MFHPINNEMFIDSHTLSVYHRHGRTERDLRQKRQLLESQREKIKTLTQQCTEARDKLVRAQSNLTLLRGLLVTDCHLMFVSTAK